MPRPPRIQAPGMYHLYAQSISCRALLPDAASRQFFLRLVDAATDRYVWRVQAYCLMTTHYHLLVTTEEENLGRGMQWLNGFYASTLNAITEDQGHVFGARYGSRPVSTEPYLLEVLRYIALNPVGAGLCSDPADWPWSSYRVIVRGLRPPPFLDVEFVLRLFSTRDRATARRRFEAFVWDGMLLDVAAG